MAVSQKTPDYTPILEELQRRRQFFHPSYWDKELRDLEKHFIVGFRGIIYHPPDFFDIWSGRRIINYKQYIQKLISEATVKFWLIPSNEIFEPLYREILFKEKTIRIYVDAGKLFDENIVERLLRGEYAENIVEIPKDIVEELSIIADKVVNKLLKDLDIDVSNEFRHALREWIKLWIYEFYRAAESVERG